MSDDDLTPYDSWPLVAALRAPATPAELAGQDQALAMFRAARPGVRGRTLRRLGLSGAGIVLGLGLTGGVAAAYTTGLPDPMQNALHSAIKPFGVPAPPTAHTRRLRQQLRRARELAGLRGTAQHRHPLGPVPRHRENETTALPPTRASMPGAPAPSSSPTSAAAPASLSATPSTTVVPVHSGLVVSGRLARGGSGLSDRPVYLAELAPGTSGWRRVAAGRTDSDGAVSLTVPALTSNVRLRLVSESGVTSRQIPIAVVPALSVTLARSQGQRVATVTADGGVAGDDLVLLRRNGTAWTKVAATTLDGSSSGTFTVPGPGSTRVRYRVRLPATGRHAAAFADFVVAAG